MSRDFAVPPGGSNEETLDEFETVKFLGYAGGELLWGSQDGDDQEPTGRLKEADIVFILQPNDRQQLGPEGHCFISSVADGKEETPFKLTVYKVVNPVPQPILDKYLLTSPPSHLVCDATRRVTVVVSTRSGLCQAESFYAQVLSRLLRSVGLAEAREWSQDRDQGKYEVITTTNDHTVKDLGKQLAGPSVKGQARTIVLLSGDGGVFDLINDGDQTSSSTIPSRSKPTIALLPLGTGNALFHSLHKPLYDSPTAPPSSYVLGLRTLFRGAASPLPMFEASFAPGSRLISYSDGGGAPDDDDDDDAATAEEQRRRAVSRLTGAIVASYGFHANLVWESDTPAYRKHGAQRFHMAAAQLLRLGHGYEADVDVRLPGAGREEWTRLGRGEEGHKFGYVLATLVSSLEKTFTISPDSKPLNRKLRLVTFGDVGGERTMDVMKAAYNNGSHVGMKWTSEEGKQEGVGYQEVEEVRVTVREEDARWRKVCIDGTIVEVPPHGGWMRVKTSQESRFYVVVDKSVV